LFPSPLDGCVDTFQIESHGDADVLEALQNRPPPWGRRPAGLPWRQRLNQGRRVAVGGGELSVEVFEIGAHGGFFTEYHEMVAEGTVTVPLRGISRC
jgi:hypothetical protein